MCGLPRRSVRSFVATCTFMASGFATIALRNALGVGVATTTRAATAADAALLSPAVGGGAVIAALLAAAFALSRGDASDTPAALAATAAAGGAFGVGLSLSGMLYPSAVLDFLAFSDFSLAFVMCGALMVNFITFPLILGQKRPLFVPTWSVPTRTDLTSELVIGAAVFGVGWGVRSQCALVDCGICLQAILFRSPLIHMTCGRGQCFCLFLPIHFALRCIRFHAYSPVCVSCVRVLVCAFYAFYAFASCHSPPTDPRRFVAAAPARFFSTSWRSARRSRWPRLLPCWQACTPACSCRPRRRL